jgi:hypothetical protein
MGLLLAGSRDMLLPRGAALAQLRPSLFGAIAPGATVSYHDGTGRLHRVQHDYSNAMQMAQLPRS